MNRLTQSSRMTDTPPMMPALPADVTGVSGIACSDWLAVTVENTEIVNVFKGKKNRKKVIIMC